MDPKETDLCKNRTSPYLAPPGAPVAAAPNSSWASSASLSWVDIDQDEEGRTRVQEVNGGKQIIPTIVFQDGSILVEPSNALLGAKLGISPKAKRKFYDLIVVGGGLPGYQPPSTLPEKVSRP